MRYCMSRPGHAITPPAKKTKKGAKSKAVRSKNRKHLKGRAKHDKLATMAKKQKKKDETRRG
jgi:hypothetical protein